MEKVRSYNWNAKDYASNSAAQRQWADELIDKLQLQGAEHVLDIGCGDGSVTAEIARRLPQGQVTGIDSSAAMIALANERHPPSAHPRLAWQEMDARELPFHEQFDLIFSNAALHWIKDHRPVVAGIARGLRPGGRLLLQMGGRGNAAGILAVADRLLAAAPWQEYFVDFAFPYGFLGVDDYTTLLQDQQLKINRIELLTKDMVHADIAAFTAWIRTTWLPYTQRVPPSLQQRFIEQLVHAYLTTEPIDSAGRVHVAMVRLEVDAAKPGARPRP